MNFQSKPFVIDRSPIKPSRSPAGTIAEQIDPVIYHEAQHETWRLLCARQLQAWQGRVHEDLHFSQRILFGQSKRIPTLADLSQRLGLLYGWRLVRVDGLVPFDEFTAYLAAKLFPCSDAIRDITEIEYTNEPDMFHDLMGHLPTLAHPFFASLNQIFGDAGTRIKSERQRIQLEKIYWYCMEFGIINPSAFAGPNRDPSLMRAYGAGLLAAPAELQATFVGEVPIRPFSIDAIVNASIDVYRQNDFLFEVDNFVTLGKQLSNWLRYEGLYL